jgi:phosphoglycolate phosphatase
MATLVVFDLDGTLVDSRHDLAASTNDVLAGLGADPLPVDVVEQMVGDGARTLVHRALVHSGCDADLDTALAEFHRRYALRLLEATRPYEGIDDVLRSLAGTRMAVLTNKPLEPTLRLLQHFGWTRTFDRVIGGDGPFPRKPDPAGLRDLMSSCGADPDDTLMVGDSMVDVDVARRAGTHICVAAYGFGAARGDLTLRGDELVAQTAADIYTLWSRRPLTPSRDSPAPPRW